MTRANATIIAAVLLCPFLCRTAAAQAEITGSWTSREFP
jgi:hypothetical protein